MKKILFAVILLPLVYVAYVIAQPSGGYNPPHGGSGTSFSVTDITGQTDDTTPATTATAVLAQGGSLIESTLAQIGTAITAGGNIPNTLADAAGDLIQGSADNTWAKLTKGAEGTLLRAGASSNAYTTSTFADTYAKGTFLYAATANTIASLAHPGAANYFLMTNAADTSAWTAGAALASINSLTETNGGLPYGTADNAYAWLAAGATGKVLIAKGAAAPEWTPYTFPATVPTVGKVLISDGTNLIGSTALGTAAYAATGDFQAASAALLSLAGLTETAGGIPYGTADNTYAWLAAGAEGTLLMGNGAGAPSWLAAGTSGYFLIAAGAADPVWTSQPTLAALEALTLTQGGLLYSTAADTPAVLAKGTANQVLRMNSGATAPEWTSTLNISTFNIDRQAGDGTYSGNTMSGTAGETLAFGQPVYMKSDGKFWLADADAAATMPALGLVVVGGNAEATVYILTHGLITETDWNWTVGNTIYVADGTAGAVTATLADISDENDVVQVVGIAVHADSIFVNPSLTTVVLAAP